MITTETWNSIVSTVTRLQGWTQRNFSILSRDKGFTPSP